jgi:hypothetical protein
LLHGQHGICIQKQRQELEDVVPLNVVVLIKHKRVSSMHLVRSIFGLENVFDWVDGMQASLDFFDSDILRQLIVKINCNQLNVILVGLLEHN